MLEIKYYKSKVVSLKIIKKRCGDRYKIEILTVKWAVSISLQMERTYS